MTLLSLVPARYAKFVTSLVGLLITYVTIYGWVWHTAAALVMIGAALGVYGVPNAASAPKQAPVP